MIILISVSIFKGGLFTSFLKYAQATDWEKMFAQDTSDKGLLCNMYKDLLKLSSKKMNSPILKRARDLNGHFTKDMEMMSKHMKRCPTSYVTREVQIKTTVRHHCTAVRVAKT